MFIITIVVVIIITIIGLANMLNGFAPELVLLLLPEVLEVDVGVALLVEVGVVVVLVAVVAVPELPPPVVLGSPVVLGWPEEPPHGLGSGAVLVVP